MIKVILYFGLSKPPGEKQCDYDHSIGLRIHCTIWCRFADVHCFALGFVMLPHFCNVK